MGVDKLSVDTQYSGTCSVTLLISEDKCYIANLGDSRAILCKEAEDGKYKAVNLCVEHKPTNQNEKNRVIQAGGVIEAVSFQGMSIGPVRVWNKNKEGGLSMTRSMGDQAGKSFGLISEPELTIITLDSTDKFFIVASDGLWDVMSSQEAIDFVLKYNADGKAGDMVARSLVKEAYKRWKKQGDKEKDPYCDDITVIVAYPQFGTGTIKVKPITVIGKASNFESLGAIEPPKSGSTESP